MITKEAIEAGCAAITERRGLKWPSDFSEEKVSVGRENMELAITAAIAAMPGPAETLESYFARQIEWSRQTFGPAFRTKGVIEHIRKELKEIEQAPHDLSEWIDVVILAMDGFWRHGGEACNLLPALVAKQQKNMARTWPDWRVMSEDSTIEHDRSGEPRALTPAPDLVSENDRLRAALERALDTLDIYADPSGYVDGDGELVGSPDQYEGLAAKLAAQEIRAALERT